MQVKWILRAAMIAGLGVAVSFCAPPGDDAQDSSSGRYLYVATGACYSGNGITTYTNTTASNQIYRIDLATGQKETIADYYASPSSTGDSPVSLVNYDNDHILVLVENTTTVSLRRVELVQKAAQGSRTTYTNNITALSAQLRRMRRLSDDYLLVSKSTAAEKIKDGTNRLLAGANPWLSLAAPASSCTTSSTLISSLAQLASGLLVFGHASAGQARIGVVSPLGYTIAGDCKAGQSSPTANSFPTDMFYDSANTKLIVSYGGNSTGADLNTIYAYSMDESTGAISSPQELYDANLFGSTYSYLLFGVSSMAYDSATQHVYVATAINTATTAAGYRIERFAYAPSQIGTSNSTVLTKDPSVFYDYGYDTRCISDMMVGN